LLFPSYLDTPIPRTQHRAATATSTGGSCTTGSRIGDLRAPPGGAGDEGRPVLAPDATGEETGEDARGED
jgi:hypothetical protein